MLRTTRVALAMPLALSLYWSTVYRPHTRHDRGLVFGSERLLLLLLIYCRPANLTPLYRHLHPETDHLRHRCHDVRPDHISTQCYSCRHLRRAKSPRIGPCWPVDRLFRSGQLIVALQRLAVRHLRDRPRRDNYSRPLFVDRPTANDRSSEAFALQRRFPPSWSRRHRPIPRTCWLEEIAPA